MLFIRVIIILVIGTNFLYAAVPLIKVSQIPPDEQLELYEESEELYALKVMEYFYSAAVLRTQLVLSGRENVREIFPPTLEELTVPDIEIIKKYYRIAWDFYNQVLAEPERKIVQLQQQIITNEKKHIQEVLNTLQDNWTQLKDCQQEKLDIIKKLNKDCYERISKLYKALEEQDIDMITILSVSISENLFLNNNGQKVTNDPSLGVRINLNVYKLFGFWRGLDIWYEYVAPRIITTSIIQGMPSYELKEVWNSNLHSIGFSGRIMPIINLDNYTDGFKLGLGYFWANGYIYNKSFTDYDWSGLRGDVEYFAGNFARFLPIELYISFSVFHSLNKELILRADNFRDNEFNLSRTNFALTLGLRYNFWRTIF